LPVAAQGQGLRVNGKTLPPEGRQTLTSGSLCLSPSKLACGERGTGVKIPPNSTLNFAVELLSLRKQEQLLMHVIHDSYVMRGMSILSCLSVSCAIS
jgi:hypothetical protein